MVKLISPAESGALDTLLASYAGGHLSAALHALVSSHLVLSTSNQAFVAALETCLSRAIELAPVDGAPEDRDRRLNAIFEHGGATEPAGPGEAAGSASADMLPEPLRRFVGKDISALAWRTRIPGLREYTVEKLDGAEASLLWVRAGRKMPSHTHGGSEVTLVLSGSFDDHRGRYGRGEIVMADAEVDHAPRAGSEEDCLCFTVIDAPLRLTSPIGQILSQLLGGAQKT